MRDVFYLDKTNELSTLQKFQLEYGKKSIETNVKKDFNNIGKYIKHPKYGEGIIIDESETTYFVRFEGLKVKELLKSFTFISS